MALLDDVARKPELSDADLDEIESEFDPGHIVWRLTAEVRRLRGQGEPRGEAEAGAEGAEGQVGRR